MRARKVSMAPQAMKPSTVDARYLSSARKVATMGR